MLRTERLILRRWRAADRPIAAAMNADPEVRRSFAAGPLSRAQSDAQIDGFNAEIDATGFGFWALERRADGAVLGFTGLSRHTSVAHLAGEVEIGWRLARAFWGNGYATEAAWAACRFGFDTCRLKAIFAYTVADNAASRAVMGRIGMRHDPAEDFADPELPRDHALSRLVVYRKSASD